MKRRGLRISSGGTHLKWQGRKVWIPSAMQAVRAEQLVDMANAGWISDLDFEVRIPLIVENIKVCTYAMDAVYRLHTGQRIYEETKGFEQPEWKVKARLFTALIGPVHVVKIEKTRPEYDEHGERRRKPATDHRLGAAISSGTEAMRQEWAWRLPGPMEIFEAKRLSIAKVEQLLKMAA